MFVIVDKTPASRARIDAANISWSQTQWDINFSGLHPEFKLHDGSQKKVSRRTTVLDVGDVSWHVRGNDDGQHDKAEHEQENNQVERNQEAQKGEVGQDPCSEHPYEQMKEKHEQICSTKNTTEKHVEHEEQRCLCLTLYQVDVAPPEFHGV